MDNVQRRILINQYEILKRLDASNKYEVERYSTLIEALESGYPAEVARIVPDPRSSLTDQECEEVRHILDMFDSLDVSVKKLNPTEVDGLPHAYRLKFRGFDGNNDDQYSYARYIVEKEKRFESLEIREFNSHGTVLPTYRRMLEQYQQTRAKFGALTLAQIQAVLA